MISVAGGAAGGRGFGGVAFAAGGDPGELEIGRLLARRHLVAVGALRVAVRAVIEARLGLPAVRNHRRDDLAIPHRVADEATALALRIEQRRSRVPAPLQIDDALPQIDGRDPVPERFRLESMRNGLLGELTIDALGVAANAVSAKRNRIEAALVLDVAVGTDQRSFLQLRIEVPAVTESQVLLACFRREIDMRREVGDALVAFVAAIAMRVCHRGQSKPSAMIPVTLRARGRG